MDANPDPGSRIAIEIAFLLIILIINGLTAAADKAISSVNRNNIREMAEDGNKRAAKLEKLFDRSNKVLSAATVVSIFLAFLTSAIVMSTPQFSVYRWFSGIKYGYVLAGLILTMIVSCIFLVLGVLLPRQIALKHSEGVALRLSGYAAFITNICAPFSAIANGLTTLFLKIFRQGSLVKDEQFSEEEVMSMLEVGQEHGDIKEEGKKMIDSILDRKSTRLNSSH